MAKGDYESSITEKWFGKANLYEPKGDIDYEWVWEYAKFRLAWATERGQHIESKALEIVKLVLGSAATAWAVLTFLAVKPHELPRYTWVLLVVSFLLLLASGICALRAYLPAKRLLPVAEDAALRCAESYARSSEAMAKFAQTLSGATEYETDVAARKSWHLWVAALLFSLAVILFLSALFLGVHR
jgi:hypothetical protein